MSAPSFASSHNLQHLETMYAAWKSDSASVDADWRRFFEGFEFGYAQPAGGAVAAPGAAAKPTPRADTLIYSYRDIGHTIAELDPIGFNNVASNPHLELSAFGFGEADLDREFPSDGITGMPPVATLRAIIEHLRSTYSHHIGVEYQHIQDHDQRHWVRNAVEGNANRPVLDAAEKRRLLMKLNQAEMLETFIHTKFLGQKRFSIEGGEALIPGLDAILELSPELGVKEVVMGMAHRGRLNVLCNILHKSYEEVFTEFEGTYDVSQLQGDGDVKYHMGFSNDHVTAKGGTVHVTLSGNPSHLEAVNPVVLGRVRAKQRQHGDTGERGTVVPILIHGDAAFSGQGLVMEVFQLGQLEGYRVGGTIHVIVNNQIGFTTLPGDSRSTRYCTDIAKMVDAPVFHVNGDDPEAVVHVMRLALRWRQQYKRDVIVDIVCYRRHGHNETDEPNFTQPQMYARIAEHPRIRELYTKQLLSRGDITQTEADAIATIMHNQLNDALATIKAKPARLTRSRGKGAWSGLTNQWTFDPVATGAPADVLERIGKALSMWPAGFNIHPKIKRIAEDRGKVMAEKGRIDWALGELLAIGSLLAEGTPVRLSGQDCRRGTFSQRHCYWYDTKSIERYNPLSNVQPGQAKFCVYNSPLIENGVLGFDYGYSISEPNMLIMWEAQFGDFVNGAQVVIDQFITSAESKWGRDAGIVMLLPHGYEGMGAEHSSARLERFLQSCAENNIQVAYCSTAAQHFHILRRQMKRNFRKPLVLMTPKGHLRSKQASSDWSDFVNGSFHEFLGDGEVKPADTRRVVFCTGKISHELMDRRRDEKLNDVAIIRVEQLYPFNDEAFMQVVTPYLASAKEIVWCQEEPQNMGAWFFMEPRLRKLLKQDIAYAGREAAAAPAPGSHAIYAREQEDLIAGGLGIPARKSLKAAH
jgi:2-oxoglutarate dehydrogenase E1 component